MPFDQEVHDALKNYAGSVFEVFQEVAEDVAKEATQKLKKESPKREGKSKHEYSKHWRYKVENGRVTAGAIIYGASPTYRLAHLLEYGHAKRGGGRVNPSPEGGHIKPVEEWADKQIVERIARKIGGMS